MSEINLAALPNLSYPDWRVFPVESRGKRPLVKDWPNVATGEPRQVEAWAKTFTSCNWGLATGAKSGVFVLDVDGERGEKSITALLAQGNTTLPETLTVKTGKGWHLYFAMPANVTIRNSASELGDGLDIRSDGGFVVVPPSIHESGKVYAFVDPATPIAPAPQWLIDALTEPGRAAIVSPSAPSSSSHPTSGEKAYAAKALYNECETLAAITTGRNIALNNAALKVGTMVGAGWIDKTTAENALWESAQRNGYRSKDGDNEAWATLQSGLTAGIKQPREPLRSQISVNAMQQNANHTPQSQNTPASAIPLTIDTIPSVFSFDDSGIDFVVEGLFAGGAITMISGDAGSGKTTFITKVASAIANGEPFLGRSTVQRKVLYLDRENSLPIVRERLERLNVRDNDNLKYFGQWITNVVPAPGSDIVSQWVANNTPRPIVFVDSFIRFLEGNENSSEDVQLFFAQLNSLKQLGASIVLLHHTGKGDSTKEFRGSSDIKAAIDVGFILVNRGGTRLEHLALTAFKARFTVAEAIAMIYRDGELVPEESKQQTELVLEQLLFDNSGITKAEFEDLSKPLGITRTATRKFVEHGKNNGTVNVRKGDGNAFLLSSVHRDSLEKMVSRQTSGGP